MDDEHQERNDAEQDIIIHVHANDKDLGEGLQRSDANNIVGEIMLEGGTGQPKTPALDGGWGWFVVLGAFLVHVLMGGMERSHGVIYLQLLDRFSLSATMTSWVLSLCSSALFLVGPVMGALNRKFNCRPVEGLGAALTFVGLLLSGFAPNLPFLYFSYSLLAGVGRGLSYGTSLVILGQYFEKRLGLAVGLATSGTGVGTFFMPPLAEFLFVDYGFRGAFLILSAVASHCFLCALLFRPRFAPETRTKDDTETTTRRTLSEDQTHSDKNDASAHFESRAKEVESNIDTKERQRKLENKDETNDNNVKSKPRKLNFQIYLLKNYAFTATCIQIFFHSVAQQCTIVFLPALARQSDLTPVQGALLISVIGISDAVSKVVLSTILDLQRVKPYRLVVYNLLVFLIGIVAATYPSMRTMWQFALLSAMFGAFSGTFVSQKSVVIVDILGTDNVPGTLGLLLLFQGAGSLVGPTLGAVYQDVFGGYEMAFYLGAVGLFTGGVVNVTGNVWLYLHRKRRHA